MARTLNKISAAAKEAKPKDAPYKLADGGGLVLLVHPNGSKYWRLRYRHSGREKMLALGIYPSMSLAEARQAASAAREQIRDHVDPSLVLMSLSRHCGNYACPTHEKFASVRRFKLPLAGHAAV